MTVFVVDHNGLSLEAFGRTGRLWKTVPFGRGGFRGMAITGTSLVGETRHPFPPWWVGFSVNLATGEVRLVSDEELVASADEVFAHYDLAESKE